MHMWTTRVFVSTVQFKCPFNLQDLSVSPGACDNVPCSRGCCEIIKQVRMPLLSGYSA